MHHRQDGSYNSIGHYMDHWSKVHVLFPLMQKCAEEVALSQVVEEWPGETTLVNGRARHPQSQGLVERANAKVEQMLAYRFKSVPSEESPWTLWLPQIQCKLCVPVFHF